MTKIDALMKCDELSSLIEQMMDDSASEKNWETYNQAMEAYDYVENLRSYLTDSLSLVG